MQKMVICLNLGTSKLHYGWLLASHILPVIACLFIFPLALFVVIPLAILLGYYHIFRIFSVRRVVSIQEVVSDESKKAGWLLTLADGTEQNAWLYRSGMFGVYWIYLLFLDKKGKSYPVLIFPDSLDRESRRQLRLKLRHG